MTAKSPCKKCHDPISPDARRCPSCGYEPATDGSTGRKIIFWLGVFLTLWVVGAPLGIPMMAAAKLGKRNARKRKPTEWEP